MNGNLTSNPIRMRVTDLSSGTAEQKHDAPTGDEFKRFETLAKKLATEPKPKKQTS